MIGIYKIENLINGKVYIGQSVNIENRLRDHKRIGIKYDKLINGESLLYKAIQKYKIENFSFEILEECTQEELDDKEKYWIQYFNSCALEPNSHGYNLTYGGQNRIQTLSKEEIDFIVQLWNSGKTTVEISKIVNHSPRCVQNYLETFSDYTISEGIARGEAKVPHGRKVNLYDQNQNFICQYASIKEAAENLKCSIKTAQATVADPNRHFLDGTFLIYADINQKESLKQRMNSIKNRILKLSKPVEKIDKHTNEIIKAYTSINEAIKELKEENSKASQANISACCNGKRKTAYGYKWRFINND